MNATITTTNIEKNEKNEMEQNEIEPDIIFYLFLGFYVYNFLYDK